MLVGDVYHGSRALKVRSKWTGSIGTLARAFVAQLRGSAIDVADPNLQTVRGYAVVAHTAGVSRQRRAVMIPEVLRVLTHTEVVLLKEAADGKTNGEIARERGVPERGRAAPDERLREAGRAQPRPCGGQVPNGQYGSRFGEHSRSLLITPGGARLLRSFAVHSSVKEPSSCSSPSCRSRRSSTRSITFSATCCAVSELSAPRPPQAISLVSSAALGEALLFLATSSQVELTDRRVVLVRELSRHQVRCILDGQGERDSVPLRLQNDEPPGIMHELRRAVSYGATAALLRFLREPSAIAV